MSVRGLPSSLATAVPVGRLFSFSISGTQLPKSPSLMLSKHLPRVKFGNCCDVVQGCSDLTVSRESARLQRKGSRNLYLGPSVSLLDLGIVIGRTMISKVRAYESF